MRTTLPPTRTRRAALLYAGLVVFALLAALSIRSVARAWRERAGQARTAAVFELVQQRMPSRPVEAPGAIAWLRDQLGRYQGHLPPGPSSAFGRLLPDADTVPPELQPAATVLRRAGAALAGRPAAAPRRTPISGLARSRRTVSLLEVPGASAVVTRRHALDTDDGSNAFAGAVLPAMGTAATELDRALAGVARPVRLYVLAEDGTLISRPWGARGGITQDVLAREAVQLSSRPALPSFAPEEFFFRFDDADEELVRYSGFYVDLGGRGLVSTLTRPLAAAGQGGVLALDVSHTIDWDHFASTIPPPLAAAVVHTGTGRPETWDSLRQALPSGAPEAVRAALDAIGSNAAAGRPVDPIAHAVVGASGAVAAFHVSDGAWLLTFFPSSSPAFPTGTVVLLAAVLGVLLTGFEVTRRWAEREADRAAQALAEKQNLLNTMQVPLVVVDPNSDEVVSANAMAESIGIRRGARFADRVAADPRAREHYAHTQVATTDPRRAYGVPIRVDGPDGATTDQFALVRSVAVTAPIEALAADERHRLAILFLVDPGSDLRLLLDDIEAAAHSDERRRLAGLLSHGVDPVAEVMRRTLHAGADSTVRWLADYLQRRLHVTAWLLDHWESPPPPHDAVVDAAQAHETLNSLAGMFTAVRRDRELRTRLGWMNGPLSTQGDSPVFEASIDWPDEFTLTLPVRGGLGFFLSEVLANAMRHGAADAPPRISVTCDRVRRELSFRVENETREQAARGASRYGGLGLLEGMARLFGWQDFQAGPAGRLFVVSWRAPVSRRDRPGRPD